jgi:hypothetical protein
MFPALVALFVACAPPTFPEDTLPVWQDRTVEATYDQRFDQVWPSVVSTVSDAYPIDEVDKAKGRITTEWVIGGSDYIFNVFSGTRIPEKIRFRMAIDVNERAGRTLVRIRNQEQVEKDIISANLTFTGAVYEWIDVPSSGGKERDVLEGVADALARAKSRGSADLDYRE